MNEFKESLKVSEEEMYENYLKEKRRKELAKEKWQNAKKRLEEKER